LLAELQLALLSMGFQSRKTFFACHVWWSNLIVFFILHASASVSASYSDGVNFLWAHQPVYDQAYHHPSDMYLCTRYPPLIISSIHSSPTLIVWGISSAGKDLLTHLIAHHKFDAVSVSKSPFLRLTYFRIPEMYVADHGESLTEVPWTIGTRKIHTRGKSVISRDWEFVSWQDWIVVGPARCHSFRTAIGCCTWLNGESWLPWINTRFKHTSYLLHQA